MPFFAPGGDGYLEPYRRRKARPSFPRGASVLQLFAGTESSVSQGARIGATSLSKVTYEKIPQPRRSIAPRSSCRIDEDHGSVRPANPSAPLPHEAGVDAVTRSFVAHGQRGAGRVTAWIEPAVVTLALSRHSGIRVTLTDVEALAALMVKVRISGRYPAADTWSCHVPTGTEPIL